MSEPLRSGQQTRMNLSAVWPFTARPTYNASGMVTFDDLTATDINSLSGTLNISKGGTGQTSANAALNALLPDQTGNNGKFLKTNGTNTSWDTGGGGGSIGGTIAINQIAVGTGANTIGGYGELTFDHTSNIVSLNGRIFQVQSVTVDPGGNFDVIKTQATISLGAGSVNSFTGNSSLLTFDTAQNYTGTQIGQIGQIKSTAANLSGAIGVLGALDIQAGTHGDLAGTGSQITLQPGVTITNLAGLIIPQIQDFGATVTNAYGAKIDAPGVGVNRWTLGVGTGNSYIGGSIHIGASTAPTEALEVTGNAKFNGRILAKKGVDVASTGDLTLGNGNFFTITGNTQINAITTTGWTASSGVVLQFTGTPLVKYNTAGGAGTAPILLPLGQDFQAVANSLLTLIYNGINWIGYPTVI